MTRRLASVAVLVLTALPMFSVNAQPRGGDGYFFRRPPVSVALRGGFVRPDANSELFDFVSNELTVDRGDFLSLNGVADISFGLSDRTELQFTAGVTNRRVGSEYRGFVDNNDQPIEQSTSFRRVPLALGFKYNLVPTGRSISRFAWVPARFVPYVAAGGGTMYYQFRQSGDFIDYQTMDVFGDKLQSSGWTGMAYGALGASWSLTRSVGLSTEVRYDHARGAVGQDFEGFDRIALSGVGVTAGFLFRF
ncbi:MAG: hypothetical protein IBJ03_18090 [Gemmatimonadaceae bacterium]|nr:hypothetical protein [Gemmatimonadaceae bacterium]